MNSWGSGLIPKAIRAWHDILRSFLRLKYAIKVSIGELDSRRLHQVPEEGTVRESRGLFI